jgi:hypothetical protein
LFIAQFLAALALVVGYRTRMSCFVVFMLLTSLHSYSPWLLNGGDDTMRIFLLWGCFLPLGRRWSVDAALRNVRDDALASQDPAYAQLLARRRRRDWSPQHESVFSAGTNGSRSVFFFCCSHTSGRCQRPSRSS